MDLSSNAGNETRSGGNSFFFIAERGINMRRWLRLTIIVICGKVLAKGLRRETDERRKKIRGLTEKIKASGWFEPTLRYSSLNDFWSSFRRSRRKPRKRLVYEP